MMAELIKVSAKDWQLTVVGPLPQLPNFIPVPKTQIETDIPINIDAYTYLKGQPERILPKDFLAPIFFENTEYDIYWKSSNRIQLDVPKGARLKYCTPAEANTIICHYSMNFQNEVGYVNFSIIEGERKGNLRFEVFPRKIDYRLDYIAMRDEIAGITRNLIMTAQSKTFSLARPYFQKQPTLIEWMELLQSYFINLARTVETLALNPHGTLLKEIKKTPLRKCHYVSNKDINKAMRKLDGTMESNLPKYIQEKKPIFTYNNSENRYLKTVLLILARRLQKIIAANQSDDENMDETAEQAFFNAARPLMKQMLVKTQQLARLAFLKEIPLSLELKKPSSLVYSKHPLYRQFENYARLLNGGLSVEGGLLQIGIKNIAVLYEYWCFLKLVEILQTKYEIKSQSLVKIQHLSTTVVLVKGCESALTFRNKKTGDIIQIVYNRQFSQLPTISQRPDNIIEMINKEGLFIFDAKYRLEYDATYCVRFGGSGPTIDDINTMHRYRDAIVTPHPTNHKTYKRGIIKSAIILFPLPYSEEYMNHHFYQSIEKVQIGGLPFLPGNISLVIPIIENLLNQS